MNETPNDNKPTREEWLAERRKGIGASDSPAILGVSKWGSAYSVWAEKTGLVEPDDLSDCEHIQAGNVFEEPILRWWMDRTGQSAVMWPRNRTVPHSLYPWMRCTPDAFGIDDLHDVNIQIKTANEYRSSEWEHGPPLIYNVQVQHEMAVLNAQRTILIVCFGGNRLRWYDVERNDRFINAMIPKLSGFWTLVETKEPPPIDGSDVTLNTIKRLHPNDNGKAVDLSLDDTMQLWSDALQDAKANIKADEAREKEASAQLRSAIGGSTYAILPHESYSLKTQTRQPKMCPHCGEATGPASSFRVLRSGAKIPSDAEYHDPDAKETP